MDAVVKDDKADTKFDVTVIYNGVSRTIRVNEHEAVQAVLQQAINIFAPLPNPHTLALFNVGGQELSDTTSVQNAGIRPGDRLLLRPSQVKGGAL
jgi:hypothetical protein